MFLKKLLISIGLIYAGVAQAQPPIGYWREHLPYKNTIQAIKGDQLYCATNYAVFSIDATEDLERYSKVTGLNDVGINCIAYDNTTEQLVIAYASSIIDIVKGSTVKYLGDIKRSTISGNKTINHLYCNNGLAYASTGLGIMVINLQRYEVKDTWVIGSNGNQTRVNACTIAANNYYAATAEGIKFASTNNTNLSNYTNWQTLTQGLRPIATPSIVTLNNSTAVAVQNDSVFAINTTNNTAAFLYNSLGWQISSISASEGKILVTHTKSNGDSKVVQINNNGVVEKTLAVPTVISLPKSAVLDNGSIWVADFYGGLSKHTGQTYKTYIPDGPLSNPSGQLLFDNQTLFAAAGSVNDAWNYQYNRDGIFNYTDDRWTYQGYYNTPIFDSVFDFLCLAKDPVNGSLWAGSYGGGLVNIQQQNITLYKQRNSTLQAAIGDPTSYRISGLAFDGNHHLWISNYAAPQSLHVRKADGSFKAITIPFNYFENAVSQIVVDDANQIWVVSPRGNGVFCYNYGNNIDALTDDKWKYYRNGVGAGNLPSNNVYCVAKDKNGFVWIGTDKGVAVVQCATDVFIQNCEATRPIVQQDAFAGYLFQDEEVQCIAVDGANRKWIGTKRGLWLVSADGDKILYRFTEDNSPLLSNDVKQLAIHPSTGEVFIATFKGLCSFRSTATEPNIDNSGILVFPNPVPSNFSGTIGIKGLVNNASVKITELNGRLVYQTRALGGQAVWNGRNYKGEKIASGIYLVFVKDDMGVEKAVAKIVIATSR